MNNIFLIIGMLIIPFSIMDICTFNGVKIKDRANNLGYYIVCFIVFGASLVRDPLVGSDSFNNYNSFIRIYNGERPYPKLFNAIVDLFQRFSLNYMPFFIFTNIIILVGFFVFFFKYKYRCFAMLLFVFLQYSTTYDRMRNYFAFFFVLMAYLLWQKKRWLSILFFSISVMIHPTMVCWIGILLIAYIGKNTGKLFDVVMFFLSIVMFTPFLIWLFNKAVVFFGVFFPYYLRYIISTPLNFDFSGVYVLPYIMAVSCYYVCNKKETELELLKNINWILIATTCLQARVEQLLRICSTGEVFAITLIVLSLEKMEIAESRRSIMCSVFISSLLLCIVYQNDFGYYLYDGRYLGVR